MINNFKIMIKKEYLDIIYKFGTAYQQLLAAVYKITANVSKQNIVKHMAN